MPRKFAIIILILTCVSNVYCQIPGLNMHRGAKKIEIPFEKQDNFIIVKVIYQGILPLRFIVDTGAEYTILTKKEIANLLRTTFEREITLMGTDMSSQVKAYIARKVRLDLENLTLTKDIIVLDDDYFKFDQFTGLQIEGIIGAEAFKGYVLKIDYSKQILTLYDPSVFKPSEHKKYTALPIQINRSKPYIITNAEIFNGKPLPIKLLLDTGAALAILLHTNPAIGISMPEKVIKGNIGTGLGGSIEGYLGRLASLNLGDNKMPNPICHFQELGANADSSFLFNRQGLIGGDILSRFNLIIDFPKETLYVQPNSFFKSGFDYDKSGLTFIATGENLSQFTVFEILDNSPAAETDIRRGDELVSINWIPARFYSLGALNRILQGKKGKKITLKLKRNGETIKKTFRLRDLI